MMHDTDIRNALAQVEDPEIPITLMDLGVIRSVRVDGPKVHVYMVPTRLGCPGREEMARRVRAAVSDVAPEADVDVEWGMETWTPASITHEGEKILEQHGYTSSGSTAQCPYCGSRDARQEGMFGGSLCKTPFTCRSCGSTFDALRSAVSEVGVDIASLQ